MLAIKLQRIGKKHQPSYRLVVALKRSKMAGPPVEYLGSYNPRSKEVSFDKEKILYWISKGAEPTVTVHNLFIKNQIISGKKKLVKMPSVQPKSKEEDK